MWNTVHYVGPFAFESISRSVLNTQLFIAAAALSTLYLAAVVSERERFAAGLAASRARLVDAADTERRRLERHLHDGAQQRLVRLAVGLRHAAERLSHRSRARRRSRSKMRARSWRSRSTSCASWPTASTRPS